MLHLVNGFERVSSYSKYFFSPANAQLFSLTSSPQLNGPICPGPIEFTCVGTRVPFILQWILNGTIYGRYFFDGGTSLVSISLNPPIPGVMAQVTSVSQNQDNVSINITSTLSGGTSILEGSSVQCESLPFTSNPYTVNVRGKTILTKTAKLLSILGRVVCVCVCAHMHVCMCACVHVG